MINLNVRVLATSNCDMRAAVDRGDFREDLYYRLNVFPLWLPPLRERADDVLPLAEVLIERAARAQNRRAPVLSRGAIARLASHSWPGNVRELDNTIQRALVLALGDVVEANDLSLEMVHDRGGEPSHQTIETPGDGLGDELRTKEHHLILDALRAESGNRKAVAAKLGISARTLRYKLAKMRDAGLRIPDRHLT